MERPARPHIGEAPDTDRTEAPTTLGRVLQHLGPMLLRGLVGTPDYLTPVSGLTVHDAQDPPPIPPGSIVLGIGVSDPEGVAELHASATAAGAAAIVIRHPEPGLVPGDLGGDGEGVIILGLPRGVTWHQLITVLRTALRSSAPTSADGAGGNTPGDLFGMAEAIREIIDAPVTIEDRNAVVLAYSGGQDEADPIRVEVILGRRTPEEYWISDEERGAMRAIRESMVPVFLPPLERAGDVPARGRIAMAIRARDEILGTIWAVVDEPLSPQRDELLVEASRFVAMHLLQLRASEDGARRMRAELVDKALTGGAPAHFALERLGLAGQPVIVLGAASARGIVESESAVVHASRLQKLSVSLQVHLAGTWSSVAVALIDDTVHALVPATGRDTPTALKSALRAFAEHRDDVVLVGIGRTASHVADVRHSRDDAFRALRVLRRRHAESALAPARQVALISEVETDALLLELGDLAASGNRGPYGAYARLLEHDRARGSNLLLETLEAWLESHGDITAASAAVHVHQNTFRYRMKRMFEIGDFAADDPDERFTLQLQLRLFPPRDQRH